MSSGQSSSLSPTREAFRGITFDEAEDMVTTRSQTRRDGPTMSYDSQDGTVHEYYTQFELNDAMHAGILLEHQDPTIRTIEGSDGAEDKVAFEFKIVEPHTITVYKSNRQRNNRERTWIDCDCSHDKEREACKHIYWFQDQVARAFIQHTGIESERSPRLRKIWISKFGRNIEIETRGVKTLLDGADVIISRIGLQAFKAALPSYAQIALDEEVLGEICDIFAFGADDDHFVRYRREYFLEVLETVYKSIAEGFGLEQRLLDEDDGLLDADVRFQFQLGDMITNTGLAFSALDEYYLDGVENKRHPYTAETVAERLTKYDSIIRRQMDDSACSKEVYSKIVDFLFYVLLKIFARQQSGSRSRDLLDLLIRNKSQSSFVLPTLAMVPAVVRQERRSKDGSEVVEMILQMIRSEPQDSTPYKYWATLRQIVLGQ